MDMKIIGEALAAAAASLVLIDKYGWLKGGGIATAVMALLVILAMVLRNRAKKEKKEDEPSAGRSIGEGATTEGEMKFEGITQKNSPAQSVGKGAKAKEGMSFTKIRQE